MVSYLIENKQKFPPIDLELRLDIKDKFVFGEGMSQFWSHQKEDLESIGLVIPTKEKDIFFANYTDDSSYPDSLIMIPNLLGLDLAEQQEVKGKRLFGDYLRTISELHYEFIAENPLELEKYINLFTKLDWMQELSLNSIFGECPLYQQSDVIKIQKID